jgi:uncharacterized protein
MTNEERNIITQFIARVGGVQALAQPSFGGGSVPATTAAPPMPPVDPEADRLIAEQFARYPEARYRLTQLAFIQEHALAEAQNRIQRLEWELQQAQQALQQAQQQAQQAPQQQPSGSGGGIFGGLFGGASRSAPPPQQQAPVWNQGAPPAQPYPQAVPPPPQYAPSYQPGMFQRQGSGFLGSALTTAAGVAGGLVAGNALMSLFSGSHGMGGGFGGGFGGGYPGGMPMTASPWGTAPVAAPDQGYVDQGTWDNSGGGGAGGGTDPGYVDNGTWDTSGDASGGGISDDSSSDSGGGSSDSLC